MNLAGDPKSTDLRFGRFAIDIRGERALFDAKPIRLRRKALEVLTYLVVRRGRIVTVDELLDASWPGLAVTPHSVTVIISTLRRLLARDESLSCRIESVYGRGYRFVVQDDPQVLPEVAEKEPESVASRSNACVARESEIARLERYRDRVRDGTPQVVLLGGDAGVGKSSLVREFARRTSEATDVLVLSGRCLESVDAPEPHQPVLEMLESLEKHLGRSELTQQMRQFAPTWLVQFPWLATTEEILALRESLAGTHSGRVLRELRKLLEAIATHRAFVLIIEDLHRAEPATIEFVRSVATAPLAARVLLLATYRPIEAFIRRAEVLALRKASPHVETIDLDPWSQTDIESYLRSRFGTEISPTLVGDIERRSRGNPLLVTAMLDAMVRDGKLEKRGAGWFFDESVDASYAPLPDEIRSLAQQQLGLLPMADRRLLEVAATFGDEFRAADVTDVAGIDPEDCVDRLAELCELRFFIGHNDPLATGGDHAFLHTTFRQAILESLPAGRSRRLYRQTAEYIEKCPRDRLRADDLAEKFTAGHAWNKAADQWERAAARAVQQYAHAEAATFVRRAIEAIERARPSKKRDVRLADRYLDLANLTIVAAGYADASVRESFGRARRLAEGCPAERTAFRARAGETIVTAVNGHLYEAASHAAALESASEERPEWRSMTALYVAYVEWASGRFERGRQLCDEGLRWVSRAEPGMPALRDLGISLASQRLAFRVLTHDDDSWLRAADEIVVSLPSTAVGDIHTYYVLMRTAVLGGRNDLARAWAARCLEIADTVGESSFAIRSRAFAAFSGEHPADEAAKTIAAVLSSPSELDSRLDVDLLWLLLAELQLRCGDPGAARDSLDEAHAVGFPTTRSILWRLAGDLAAGAEQAGFDLRDGARPDGIIATCPAPIECYGRAAEVARSQQAPRLVRLANEAAEKL